jgi:hypothetical protein
MMLLENIHVYWTSIDVVPKGIITKINNLSFQFLWFGSRLSSGIILVKWSCVETQKSIGG